jgi:hypothetical protein
MVLWLGHNSTVGSGNQSPRGYSFSGELRDQRESALGLTAFTPNTKIVS